MACTDSLLRSSTAWNTRQAAETIRYWQQLLPWGLTTMKASGTILFEQDSSVRNIYLLDRGLVKLSCTLLDGQQLLLSLCLPGQLIGGTCLHAPGESCPFSAFAATDCRVCCVSADTMRRELARDPAIAQFLLRQQGIELHNQTVSLVEAKTLTTTQLFTAFVRRLATVLDTDRVPGPQYLRVPLSDIEIASLLGVTKEHFSRLKRQLEDRGLFTWKGRTLVINSRP